KDDILREKLLNINLLIAKIEALNDNPTPSFDFMTKSFSTSLNSLLEETNTFDKFLPEFETFCFDVEEISSGTTTTHSDISLPEYKAFYDNHVKEISSGSTTNHSDSSLYDSFIFDLSINPFPLADRSDFYEFVDELIHIISLPEYDCFFFKIEPNSGDFTMDVVEDISLTKEPRVHNALPTHPTLQLNLEFKPSCESLFTYVISSGSPNTHSDSSLYASFIFDLSVNPFPPADRSDFYEFTDEIIPFISLPEYDCFLFTVKPNSRDFTKDVVEDISPTKEPQVHNALPTYLTLQLNLKFQSSSESLFTYVI
nr:hypothetical protein [Tanacetum cinerariifolium]